MASRGGLELRGRLDQVAAEGDAEVAVLAIDGVAAVTLEHAHPDGIASGQWQQQLWVCVTLCSLGWRTAQRRPARGT